MTDDPELPVHRRTILGTLAGAGIFSTTFSEPVGSATGSGIDEPRFLDWEWQHTADDPSAVQGLAQFDGETVVSVGIETTEEGTQNALIRGISSGGTLEWEEGAGGSGPDAAFDVITSDGSVLFCGGSGSRGSATFDTIVGRFDPPDSLTWFEHGVPETNDVAHAIIEMASGQYLLGGGTHYLGGGDGDGVGRLLAIDDEGNLLWEETYETSYAGEIYDVHALGDGEYVFAGTRESPGRDDEHAWIGVVDQDGDLLWSDTYGGVGSRIAYSVTDAHGDGLVFAGTTTPPTRSESTAWVGRVDEDGNLLWEETFGTTSSTGAIERTADGYVLAGWQDDHGDESAWLFEIDDSGTVQWEETYGGTGDDRFNALISTGADGHVAGGYTTDPGSPQRAWLASPDDDPDLDIDLEITDAGASIDQHSFVNSYPGQVVDDVLSAELMLQDSRDQIQQAINTGLVTEAEGEEIMQRVNLGYEVTLQLLRGASSGPETVQDDGTRVNNVHMSRRTARYTVSLVIDLIVSVVLFGKVLSRFVPSGIPEQLGDDAAAEIGGFAEDLIMDFLESDYPGRMGEFIYDYVGIEGREFVDTYLWGPATTTVDVITDILDTLIEGLVDTTTWVFQGGYETGALQIAYRAKAAPQTLLEDPGALPSLDLDEVTDPDREPQANIRQGVSLGHYGTWGSADRLAYEFTEGAIESGLQGSTEEAERMADSVVDDVTETKQSADAWMEEIIDGLLDVNLVEQIVETGRAYWDVVQQFDSAVDEAQDLWETTKDAAEEAGESAGGLLGRAADWFRDNVLERLGDAVDWAQEAADRFTELPGDIKRVLVNADDLARDGGELAWEMLQNPGDVTEFIIEGVDDTIDLVVEQTSDAVGIITRSADDVLDEIKDAAESAEQVVIEAASDARDVLEEGANLYVAFARAKWHTLEGGVTFLISMLGMIPAALGALSGGATLLYTAERNTSIVDSIVHGDDRRDIQWDPDIAPPEDIEEYQQLKELVDDPLGDLVESHTSPEGDLL